MDGITILVLFAMFSLTLVTLAIFAQPKTAAAAIKILGDAFSGLFKRASP